VSVDDEQPDLYKIFWKQIDNEEIMFELHCKSKGWIGMGISPNGDMAGADIAIGWVDSNGNSYLKDTYAASKSTPITDQHQDWFLIEAQEVDDYTILKLKRKLNTCDKAEDLEIKTETNYLIFAWGSRDPVSGNNDWEFHGQNRRIKVLYLLEYKQDSIQEETEEMEKAYKHDIKLLNVSFLKKLCLR
jgi:hypothetical protein